MEGERDDHVMGSGCFKSEAQEKVKANFGSSEGKAFHSKCREVQTFSLSTQETEIHTSLFSWIFRLLGGLHLH